MGLDRRIQHTQSHQNSMLNIFKNNSFVFNRNSHFQIGFSSRSGVGPTVQRPAQCELIVSDSCKPISIAATDPPASQGRIRQAAVIDERLWDANKFKARPLAVPPAESRR